MSGKKRKSKESGDSTVKKRNRLTLGEKLEIIKLSETGSTPTQISRLKAIHESSVRTILKKKAELKVQGTHTAEYGALSATKARPRPMLEMERLVLIWIEDCNHRGIAISLDEVQFKAKSLYDLVKSNMFDDLEEFEIQHTFDASNGWWHRFSKRMDLGKDL